MNPSWRTAWQGQDIVVFRDDVEVDRVPAGEIQRIVFVYVGSGESPGDLLHAIVQTGHDAVLFRADTGFAGRVNFERVDYWAARGCVYWVHQAQAPLPPALRRARWWLRLSSQPAYRRLPWSEVATSIEQWPVEGPQTWEQRKWRRIERSRPFSGRADSTTHRVRA